MTGVKVYKRLHGLRRGNMNQDDYDELNNLINDNYTGETGLTLKGEILPYRTEVGFTLPQQNEGKVLIHMKRGSFLENVEKDICAFESLAFGIMQMDGIFTDIIAMG